MKHASKSLAKSVLIPLGITAAAASATEAAIHKKMFGSGVNEYEYNVNE